MDALKKIGQAAQFLMGVLGELSTLHAEFC